MSRTLMRTPALLALSSLSCVSLFACAIAGCSSGDDAPAASAPPPTQTVAAAQPDDPGPPPAKDAATKPVDDPGPPPKGCDPVDKDGDGFFWRNSGKGDYVGYVPKSYTGKPTRLLVGMHGCGDDAYNFATWAVAPYDARDTQDWIAISIGDETGGGQCWKQTDEDKVFAAIADISTCFYVHQQKVVLAGFSSGGELAYGMGLRHADRFAGILIENSTASAAGNVSQLLAGAAWKLPIAHLAHTQDSVFAISRVRADWAKIKAAGFPLQTTEVPGDHDGTSDDWVNWILPKMASWKAP